MWFCGLAISARIVASPTLPRRPSIGRGRFDELAAKVVRFGPSCSDGSCAVVHLGPAHRALRCKPHCSGCDLLSRLLSPNGIMGFPFLLRFEYHKRFQIA